MVTAAGRRLTPQDVERYAQQQTSGETAAAPSVAYESLPLSATRKVIARKLTEAKQQIPHFYLSMDINMDAALQRRGQMNVSGSEKISLNDLVMRAVVLALQAVPDLNIHLVEDEIRRYRNINLALAVATDRGIISPVIQSAEKLTLAELSQLAAKLGKLARDAELQRGQLEDGTFTVSNLGMFGINEFQAIINPPQGAILALGTCEKRLVPAADGFASASIMRVTLSCDHRAIDGAVGAGFLAQLKANLESPEKL
jgi:pyruvate dehydrogenase E2 component (dihydrolipoamide acetyltransferase)